MSSVRTKYLIHHVFEYKKLGRHVQEVPLVSGFRLDPSSRCFSISKCPVLTLGEGNGTPLQYFCLENPMDGGAW